MAIKKSQLYSALWQSCDELRGGMDASQYKDYVLALLFVRYVSDKYAGQKDALVVIPEGGSFSDLAALKGKPNIGEGINTVLSALAEANELRGVIDSVDFNDESRLGQGREMQERLSNLIAIFENPELDFSNNRAEGDDLLGDAYEYLMKHFAVESGKSKGQFYTPSEVSQVMAKVLGVHAATGRHQTAYDPTCGSGSLLLKVAAEAPKGLSLYGQELDTSTAALAMMNMWLHGEPTAEIEKGQSTLSTPLFTNPNGTLKTFDFAVANPPFSYKAWRTGFNPADDKYERFVDGIPPKKNGDYAFLLHIIKSLKSTGKGAIILPHGVLFRGNGEAEIRKNLLKRGYIKGIIGLPANLFYGTGIPACIIIVDKESADERSGIFMVDASRGFVKDGNKNRLRDRDIRKIVDVFNGQIEVPKYSRFVSNDEIRENDYNLNITRYIYGQEGEDLQDIDAHLRGGIPDADIEALSDYWDICPSLRSVFFKAARRKGYSELKIPLEEVSTTMLAHKEFEGFRDHILDTFTSWRTETTKILREMSRKDHPKAVIQTISDSLLDAFDGVHLVDRYDIYQLLMSYWSETMQDDAHIITVDGWEAGKEVVRLKKTANGKTKEVRGLSGLEGRLVPVPLLISTYFASEQKTIDNLHLELEEIAAKMEELIAEHGDEEEGMLGEVIDNGKVKKGDLTKRIREIRDDGDFADELAVLNQYMQLFDRDGAAKASLKTALNDLERKVIAKYPTLSVDDIKELVVEQKWMGALQEGVGGVVDELSQHLTGRVRVLAERYRETLPVLVGGVETLAKKVDGHLKKMGFVW